MFLEPPPKSITPLRPAVPLSAIRCCSARSRRRWLCRCPLQARSWVETGSRTQGCETRRSPESTCGSRARGGSVFLDEIGELPLDLQPKLLRALENQEIQRVGASESTGVDVVVVAATNCPLMEAVERGAFRRDLHARFTARLTLPGLAQRPEDVFAILEALAKRRSAVIDVSLAEVEAIERLMLDAWTANVRDLDRVAAAIATAGQVTLAVIERELQPRSRESNLTREAAEQMVRECDGNEREAERRFGIARGRLRRALGKVGRDGQAT